MATVTIRPYDPDADRTALWRLKRAFERELGSGTGGDEKARAYEAKLTDDYRERYLEWIDRCVAEQSHALTVAGSESDSDGDLVGYAFVLPESLSLIWDAAVLNEVYVREQHRGTGVADDLLAAAIAVVEDQDLPLDRMVLDVDEDNERAAAFYRRHGFDRWGTLVARPLGEDEDPG